MSKKRLKRLIKNHWHSFWRKRLAKLSKIPLDKDFNEKLLQKYNVNTEDSHCKGYLTARMMYKAIKSVDKRVDNEGRIEKEVKGK